MNSLTPTQNTKQRAVISTSARSIIRDRALHNPFIFMIECKKKKSNLPPMILFVKTISFYVSRMNQISIWETQFEKTYPFFPNLIFILIDPIGPLKVTRTFQVSSCVLFL